MLIVDVRNDHKDDIGRESTCVISYSSGGEKSEISPLVQVSFPKSYISSKGPRRRAYFFFLQIIEASRTLWLVNTWFSEPEKWSMSMSHAAML